MKVYCFVTIFLLLIVDLADHLTGAEVKELMRKIMIYILTYPRFIIYILINDFKLLYLNE